MKSLPLYFNVLIMMVLLFFCFLRSKILVNWKHFTRYLLFLFANGVMLSIVIALASTTMHRDPLHIKKAMKEEEHPASRLEDLKNNLLASDVWNVDMGSQLLYYTDILKGQAIDSVTAVVPAKTLEDYQRVCDVLHVPYDLAEVVSDTLAPTSSYEKTYRDLLNYNFEEKANLYMLGLNLTCGHFFWTSLFLLANMICFFLAVQVIDKREISKNILFFIAMIIGAVGVVVVLNNVRADLKDALSLAGVFAVSMVVNYLFHKGRRFVEGIQKLLVFLHALMWILVIVYTANKNLETFIVTSELFLFAISVSITFFVFKRFFQPQKMTS
jgi:uncharacterized membrane protein